MKVNGKAGRRITWKKKKVSTGANQAIEKMRENKVNAANFQPWRNDTETNIYKYYGNLLEAKTCISNRNVKARQENNLNPYFIKQTYKIPKIISVS